MFENKWFREPGLREVVENCWSGSSHLMLVDRLLEVLVSLQHWGRSLTLIYRKEVQHCTTKLEQLRGYSSEAAVAEFEEVKNKMVSLLLQEEDHWR